VDAAEGKPAVAVSGSTAGTPRRIYRHSVLPGGVESPEELRDRLKGDRVAKAHFAGLENRKLRAVTLEKDLHARVSYRTPAGISWTKKAVRIRKGETVLCGPDGTAEVRGRCGNRITESDSEGSELVTEPPAEEFDWADTQAEFEREIQTLRPLRVANWQNPRSAGWGMPLALQAKGSGGAPSPAGTGSANIQTANSSPPRPGSTSGGGLGGMPGPGGIGPGGQDRGQSADSASAPPTNSDPSSAIPGPPADAYLDGDLPGASVMPSPPVSLPFGGAPPGPPPPGIPPGLTDGFFSDPGPPPGSNPPVVMGGPPIPPGGTLPGPRGGPGTGPSPGPLPSPPPLGPTGEPKSPGPASSPGPNVPPPVPPSGLPPVPDPGGGSPPAAETPEPGTLFLVGVALLAVAIPRFRADGSRPR
jgi:hypothetical protein